MPPARPREKPHDILAAEEFAMPTVDPELRRRQVTLPDDPSGIPEAHDVLAAEEFAMPAPRPRPVAPPAAVRPPARANRHERTLGVLGGLLALGAFARALRRR